MGSLGESSSANSRCLPQRLQHRGVERKGENTRGGKLTGGGLHCRSLGLFFYYFVHSIYTTPRHTSLHYKDLHTYRPTGWVDTETQISPSELRHWRTHHARTTPHADYIHAY